MGRGIKMLLAAFMVISGKGFDRNIEFSIPSWVDNLSMEERLEV